jgi:hypothetical protein
MTAPKIDALQLQDRDLTLLRGLFECRAMTSFQNCFSSVGFIWAQFIFKRHG